MTRTPRRYPTLDLLRLVAITLTILYHTPSIADRASFLRPFQNGMWLGVDLFMLISGWLLGGQLLRDASRGMFAPARFYVKRWLRTLPAYYTMLVILYFFGPEFVGPLPWKTILAHATFLQLYIPPNLYGVSWSLCVEEHFYLVLPLVVWGLMRRPRMSAALGLVVGMEVMSIACRLATYVAQPGAPQQSHMRCDGLFIGMLFAWTNLHRPEYWARLGRFAVGLGALGIVGSLVVMASVPNVVSPWTYVGVPTVGTWTLALVFLACVHDRSPWSRVSFRGLQYAGELTYAVYLVHHDIPRAWIGEHGGAAGVRGLALRFAIVGSLSVALHHLVERPALALRDRVLRRWQPVPAA